MDKTDQLALAMIEYNHGDPKRIQHTTKVHAYASLMGREEGLDAETQFILESAALVHDKAIQTVRRNIFKTKSGLKMLDSMYGDTDQ